MDTSPDTPPTPARPRRSSVLNSKAVVLTGATLSLATTAVLTTITARDPAFDDLRPVVITVLVALLVTVAAATLAVLAPHRTRHNRRLAILLVGTAAYTATLMLLFLLTPAMTAAIGTSIPWVLLGAAFVLGPLTETLTRP